MKAAVITVGDELLIGQVVDTNSTWLGQELEKLGVSLEKKITVKDTEQSIVDGVEWASEEIDIVVMTGGLGPTKDDLTLASLSAYLNLPLRLDQPSLDRIRHIIVDLLGGTFQESQISQAMLPEGAEVLFNDLGTAPGVWLASRNKIYVCMPGVPREMKGIFTNYVRPRIEKINQQQAKYHSTISTVGIGETTIEKLIDTISDRFPQNISIAYLPGVKSVRIRVSGYGNDQESLEKEVENIVQQIVALLPEEVIYSFTDQTIFERLSEMLIQRGETLAIAESCTGGKLSHDLTKYSGASRFFEGSVVSYSNEQKEKVLGVRKETLIEYGAVSEQTVIEMAEGVRKKMNTTYGIAISGVAGPSGGTEEKPVGTVWIAVSSKDKVVANKNNFYRNRVMNIDFSCVQACNSLRKLILNT